MPEHSGILPSQSSKITFKDCTLMYTQDNMKRPRRFYAKCKDVEPFLSHTRCSAISWSSLILNKHPIGGQRNIQNFIRRHFKFPVVVKDLALIFKKIYIFL